MGEDHLLILPGNCERAGAEDHYTIWCSNEQYATTTHVHVLPEPGMVGLLCCLGLLAVLGRRGR